MLGLSGRRERPEEQSKGERTGEENRREITTAGLRREATDGSSGLLGRRGEL